MLMMTNKIYSTFILKFYQLFKYLDTKYVKGNSTYISGNALKSPISNRKFFHTFILTLLKFP